MRRILPAIITVPLVVGILRILGEQYNLYDAAFGITLVIFITIIILVALSLISARSINEVDLERQKAERRVKSQAELLDITHEAIIVRDMDNNIIFWNKGSEEMYGWNKEEAVGNTTHQLLKTEFPRSIHELNEVIIKTGVWDGELIHTRRNGTKIVVVSRWALRKDEYNNHISILEVNSDITKRKKAEEDLKETLGELKRSNEELGKFAYVASHDLQEPLRMIVSYLQLFEKRYGDMLDEKGSKYMYYAVDGAKRMQRLINDLLIYSRVSTRGEEFETVDSESILNETLLNLKYSIKKNNAIIESDPLPNIIADKRQLAQLFQNLISNAIKFRKNDETPKIHISAKKDGDQYVFSVQDNGIGIDPKYGDRIFDVFHRLQKRSEYEGTG